MSADAITVPTWAPPRWVNAMVKTVLRTPGLQRMLGSTLALISVTGRRTARTYTIPVGYDRQDGTVVVLTKRFRTWWRNLQDNPGVELRLAGRTVRARARAGVGNDDDLSALLTFLKDRPRDAKAYGVTLGPDGRLDESTARALLSQIVVITIPLADAIDPLGRPDDARSDETTDRDA
jgi:deazaflavin-dependent oxidoreductase (nitroreductase family)